MRVVVVGGGMAGLAATYALATAGHQVTLLEGSPRLGGALRTSPLAGLELEEGADAFLVRTPEALALARAVGCRIVHPARGQAAVYAGGRLRPLPAGTVLGVPPSVRSLRHVVTPGGRARAALDLVLPTGRRPDDPAVGELVRRRLGSEVLDRLVDPLLGGVYAGSADGLSLRATAPLLADPQRSLLRTVAARVPVAGAGPVFGSVTGGLGAFVEAVTGAARTAGAEIQTGVTVTELSRATGADRWLIARAGHAATGRLVAGAELAADAVVLAVPAPRAARLLGGHVPAGVLPATDYASVAVVTLVYPPGTPLPAGSGFLVSPAERRMIKAATYVGQKWGHPPSAPVAVRASVGRYRQEADLQRSDAELAGVAAAELLALIGIPGRPVQWRVSRWGGALPQYAPGHLGRVQALRLALPTGLAVCGAAYDGVGIPACVRSGQAAARAVGDTGGHDGESGRQAGP